ncbi:hypothetical protein BDN72DRAFT_899979 [Pluteus cervinus]|uniref:Uncharacterized protein n=1 Tax=Pluteus cervinus TaxID=181527 RepID=A0ACD3ALB4_9AGAR|nr:hypothetical protein BDN72DRAFT_899979 [Pluteus cervinus]
MEGKPSDRDSVDSYLYPASEREKPRIIVEKRKSRIGCVLLLPTLILLFLSAGFASFLLLWLTVIHGISGPALKSAWAEGSFIVDEGRKVGQDGTQTARLLGLTISTITTNVVSITAPFLVGLSGYCVAGMWLKAQERSRDDGSNLPTPLQYGLLVKLSSVSGLKAMYDGMRYLFRKKAKLVAIPAFISTAFALVITIYMITHFISLADLWLHTTTSAVVQNTTEAFVPNVAETLYGVAYNESGPLTIRYPDVQKNGMIIAANASSSLPNPLSVITLHDEQDLAVIVPYDANPQLLWTAPSFGMRATCTNLTPQCLGNSTDYNNIDYNCSDAGYPTFPEISNPMYDFNTSIRIPGTVMDFDNIGTNPTTVVIEFTWTMFIHGLVCPNTFASFCGQGIATGFASCDIAFFDVVVQRRANGTYGITETPEYSSTNLTQLSMFPLIYSTTMTQLHMNLFPHIVTDTNDASVMAAVNQELSRTTLAPFAAMLMNVPAQDFFLAKSALVSRYAVAPVLTYVSLLFIYSLIALGIFGWASSIRTKRVISGDGKSKSTMLVLAQAHLTDPMMVVASMLGSQSESSQAVGTDPLELFAEDHDSKRLVVGVDDSGSTFCVRERKTGSWKRDRFEEEYFEG